MKEKEQVSRGFHGEFKVFWYGSRGYDIPSLFSVSGIEIIVTGRLLFSGEGEMVVGVVALGLLLVGKMCMEMLLILYFWDVVMLVCLGVWIIAVMQGGVIDMGSSDAEVFA